MWYLEYLWRKQETRILCMNNNLLNCGTCLAFVNLKAFITIIKLFPVQFSLQTLWHLMLAGNCSSWTLQSEHALLEFFPCGRRLLSISFLLYLCFIFWVIFFMHAYFSCTVYILHILTFLLNSSVVTYIFLTFYLHKLPLSDFYSLYIWHWMSKYWHHFCACMHLLVSIADYDDFFVCFCVSVLVFSIQLDKSGSLSISLNLEN